MRVLVHFLRYVRPYWIKESIIFVLVIVSTIASLIFPLITKILIDDVIPNRDIKTLFLLLSLFLAINILDSFISFLSNYLFAWVSNHILIDMRKDLFRHLMYLPLSFYNKNKTGDIVHRINSELSSIQSIVTSTVLRLGHNVLSILALTAMLCWLNFELFLLSILLVPFLALNTRYFQPKLKKIVEKAQRKHSDILGFFMDRIENIKLIQSFNGYNFENTKLEEKNNELIDIDLRHTIYSSTMGVISAFLVSLTPVLVFGWGGYQVILGTMSLGSLFAFLQYFSRIFAPFRDINRLYVELIKASVSMKRVFEFMDTPTEIRKKTKSDSFAFNDMIHFDDVVFGYNGHTVLDGLKLKIKKGKKYALVGRSGCGKSTVISLLCGFYKPIKGRILIDGRNLGDLDLSGVRDQVGLVSQNDQLFRDTIGENIRYGRMESTPAEVFNAAKLLLWADSTAESQMNLESVVDDQKDNLSGGQKQRIAIARAVLKDADILVLDEATSALDSESEKLILDFLHRIYDKRTMVLISHRLSTVKNVDEIICIDAGRVVEKGTHKTLMRKKGFYWRIFEDQITVEENGSNP